MMSSCKQSMINSFKTNHMHDIYQYESHPSTAPVLMSCMQERQPFTSMLSWHGMRSSACWEGAELSRPDPNKGLKEAISDEVLFQSQFISTGAIECVEGGGHYRPNKHAELARDIFRALERLLERRDTAQELRLLARKTHTKCASELDSSP